MSKHAVPIFLYDPRKIKLGSKEGKQKLQQIVNLYDYDLEDCDREIERIIKHLKKMLSTPQLLVYTIPHYIKFRLVKGGKIYELPIIKFLYNLILMSPAIDIKQGLHERFLFEPVKITDAVLCKYIDELVVSELRPHVNFYQMCEYLQFIKVHFNLITVGLGAPLMLSIDWTEFIELMKDSDESRATITCSYDIPANASPDKIERISIERYDQIANHASERRDLAISTYFSNGLFNKNQGKEFMAHITYKPDLNGNTIPMTDDTNLVMGLRSPVASAVDAYGGRKAEYLKLAVSDAGKIMPIFI